MATTRLENIPDDVRDIIIEKQYQLKRHFKRHISLPQTIYRMIRAAKDISLTPKKYSTMNREILYLANGIDAEVVEAERQIVNIDAVINSAPGSIAFGSNTTVYLPTSENKKALINFLKRVRKSKVDLIEQKEKELSKLK